MFAAKFTLHPEQFVEQERLLLDGGSLLATTFRYPSGVAAVRLANEWGDLILLPFQGQQIWSARFGAPGYPRRELTMRSMFEMPVKTRNFLETFGGFLQHLGALAAGSPGPEDVHPLHGELPNAPYRSAHLVLGEDERGRYVGLTGVYEHTVAFSHHYQAEPLVKLYQGATLININMAITNLKREPMELMYGAHINFRPVDNGHLVYSATRTPEHVRLRSSVPSHITPTPAFEALLAELQADPTRHETLTPGMAFDPEIVFFIDYNIDDDGLAHSLQVHPDGSADYVRHRPSQLPRATRWISRQQPDQDAIAIVEVGTCEMEGYTSEKAKGNIVALHTGDTYRCSFDAGLLAPDQAAAVEAHVETISNR
ncbi:MAG: DUF4432 family protein [Caldilineaceae bacterium]|nr:DUF4432 family protein [Caldilineaceae bacterium]